MSEAPRVSVIIPAYNSEGTIEATLEALERQTFADFETIVVDSSPGEATARLLENRSSVRFHHSEARLRPHGARNRGMELASGEIIVFTDPDCVARPDWLERLVSSHDTGHQLVGGAIEVHGGGWFERGIHISKFSAWNAGTRTGPRSDLATANVLWARELIERLGGFSDQRWSADTEITWRAQREGVEPYFEPRAVVGHTHTTGPRDFWRERRLRGLDFAEMRIEAAGWSRWRAAAQMLLVPLVPPLLLARAFGRAGLRGVPSVLVTAPVQLLGYLAWSLGEGRAFWRRAFG